MNIALLGYGTMGREIEAVALERGHSVSLKVTSENRNKLDDSDLSELRCRH